MNETYTDKKIKCIDCGNEFVFTVRDQKFFQEQNWTEPKRCKDCRNKKKQEKAESLKQKNL